MTSKTKVTSIETATENLLDSSRGHASAKTAWIKSIIPYAIEEFDMIEKPTKGKLWKALSETLFDGMEECALGVLHATYKSGTKNPCKGRKAGAIILALEDEGMYFPYKGENTTATNKAKGNDTGEEDTEKDSNAIARQQAINLLNALSKCDEETRTDILSMIAQGSPTT